MPTTTLTIDDRLLEEAKSAGKGQSEEAVVVEALEEYIARRKQRQILELFGTIDYDPEYDYKAQRRVQ
ncbi:MAG TPA: type II toxin-antitoxin system VapB family antitoxin [Candidatus Binatia bacterium]|jgi:hypothetical protein|nr:type II toxin-antitoxin system VapB family antitoxin [Candidatus Binatia bacterium]